MADDRELRRHLDLRHLRQLMEIAEKGSIRAAAAALAITQPALSRSVRSMEAELGVSLVRRGVSGTVLTASGESLLKYARIIDANLVLASKELRGMEDREDAAEHIGIGMSWLAESVLAPALIESVVSKMPSVRLTTAIGDFESLAPDLMSGKIEFFVGSPPRQNPLIGVSTNALAEYLSGVIVRANHPLAGQGVISTAELTRHNWILPLPGTLPRITYDNFFLSHGAAPPQPILEVQPLSPTIRKLLLKSDFLTFLPLVFARDDVKAGLLEVLAIEDEILFSMHVTRRHMAYDSAAIRFVLAEIKHLAEELAVESKFL